MKNFKYYMVSNGIMNQQINLRLSDALLAKAKVYSKEHGFSTIQEFIKEVVREKLFEPNGLNKDELLMIKKLSKLSDAKKLYGTEKQLLMKLKGKNNET